MPSVQFPLPPPPPPGCSASTTPPPNPPPPASTYDKKEKPRSKCGHVDPRHSAMKFFSLTQLLLSACWPLEWRGEDCIWTRRPGRIGGSGTRGEPIDSQSMGRTFPSRSRHHSLRHRAGGEVPVRPDPSRPALRALVHQVNFAVNR